MSILTDLQAARAHLVAMSDLLHQFVHGPGAGVGSTFETEAGTMRTMARLLADIDQAVQNGVAGPPGAAGAPGAPGPPNTNFTGSVVMMTAPVTSTGLVHAAGQLISRSTYNTLWTWVNANASPVGDGFWNKRRYSTGDGSTTFRVPDLRGYFPRFADGEVGVGPGAALLDKTIVSGNTTNGSASVTDLADTSFMYIGMPVAGPGIPGGATVFSVVSASVVTLSANATATAAGVRLTFSGRQFWSLQGDAIRNIAGIVNTDVLLSGPTGPFGANSIGDGGYAGPGSGPNQLTFDAGLQVPIAPENRPLNMAFHPCIVAI